MGRPSTSSWEYHIQGSASQMPTKSAPRKWPSALIDCALRSGSDRSPPQPVGCSFSRGPCKGTRARISGVMEKASGCLTAKRVRSFCARGPRSPARARVKRSARLGTRWMRARSIIVVGCATRRMRSMGQRPRCTGRSASSSSSKAGRVPPTPCRAASSGQSRLSSGATGASQASSRWVVTTPKRKPRCENGMRSTPSTARATPARCARAARSSAVSPCTWPRACQPKERR